MTMIRWVMVLGCCFVMVSVMETYYRCHDFRHTR